MNFDKAFKLLIGHEGGFTDNRSDPGNWTGGKVGVLESPPHHSTIKATGKNH